MIPIRHAPVRRVKLNLALIPLAACLAVAFAAAPAHAAACDVTYLRSGDGNWMHGRNWSSGTVPTAAQQVCIPEGAGLVEVPAGATAHAKLVSAMSDVQIDNSGTLEISDFNQAATDTSIFAWNLHVDGTLSSAGSRITVLGVTLVNGRIIGATSVRMLDGFLMGNGTIASPFEAVGGWIEPGNEETIGTLRFLSSFTLDQGAALNANAASDSSYDRVIALGTARIAGTVGLRLYLLPTAYHPTPGKTWDLIQMSSSVVNLGAYTGPEYSAFAVPGALRLRYDGPRVG
jgi:hypothetical protein